MIGSDLVAYEITWFQFCDITEFVGGGGSFKRIQDTQVLKFYSPANLNHTVSSVGNMILGASWVRFSVISPFPNFSLWDMLPNF